jgi:hypothetical protein
MLQPYYKQELLSGLYLHMAVEVHGCSNDVTSQ